MKIDRHNYEEQFLLYVDNELTVEQKMQVEAFVSANPDLEEEFIMLQQSRLVADDSIVFEGKESLMKEETAINMSNYEEWLVLYVDNELTGEQKLLVEKFAEANPQVKEELNLFGQTRLEPQEIVFDDKASLYRREEKVRVVSMSWWRVAVAAALVIAAGLGTYSVITNKSGTNETVNLTPSSNNIKSDQPEQKIINPGTETKLQTPEINLQENKTFAVKENQNKVDKKSLSQPKNKLESNQALAKNDASETFSKTTEQIKSGVQSSTPIIDKTGITSSLAVNSSSPTQHNLNNVPVTIAGPETPHYTKAIDETKVEYATVSNDENKKLRGFFRRAARFIERTTKVNPANDDDKVLIGSMAISLK